MKPTGLSASIARASSWSSAAKPRGLSRSEAILARNLLQDRPTDTVMPMSRSTSRAKRASTFAGIMPCTPLGAGEIEKRLVDRQRLDQRRQRLHGVAHLAADADVFRHVRPDHDRGMRAQRQRLEHRHRRAHAIGARDVAGGRHHAALAAADDHGLVGDARGCRASRRWRRTRRNRYGPASATAGRGGGPGEASRIRRIAAPLISRSPRQSRQKQRADRDGAGAAALTARRAPSAGRPAPGGRRQYGRVRVARRSAKAFTVASSRSTKSSTPARNCGSAAAVRRVSGPMPGFGQEQAQPLGIASNKGQRLNCNDFSHFAGVVNRLFQQRCLPFR